MPGCKKYLAEEPLKQVSIQTADQLEDLINNATAFTYDGDNPSQAYSTDDTEIPLNAYALNPTVFSYPSLSYYTFSTSQVINQPSDGLWTGEYKKIFTANLILANLAQVTGTDSVKNVLRADAYFIRAYCYWNLANHYCLPYSAANAKSPGLPLKKTTDYTEPLNRATLKETYDFILADITAAQNTTQVDVDGKRPWRISKRGIDGFLSRFYLMQGDYDKCLQYANNALTTQTATLVDFHTIKAGVPVSYTNPATTLKYSELRNWTAVQHLYWKEFLYTRDSYTNTQVRCPSTGLRALYDTSNDLRYKWFMIPYGGRRFSIVNPVLFLYVVFDDGRYIPTGPTMAEMWLNKAEALARKGDMGGALQAVNTLRAQRMNTSAPLTAIDAADALTQILQERRREMPFSMRWFDIRRFSINDDPSDDVTVERTFYKIGDGAIDTTSTVDYKLAPGSSRYAVPINGFEISNSKNQIVQNSY